MKNGIILLIVCFQINIGWSQDRDSFPEGLTGLFSLSYPERLDSVMHYVNTKGLASDEVYTKFFENELKTARERKEVPLIIAEILAHKMRMEARINLLIQLGQTTAELRELISAEGDLELRPWKILLGKIHLFLAHIAYVKYENKTAREEIGKAIAIFEVLGENFLLSECYSDRSRFVEDHELVDEVYLDKLDSIAQLIPMNRFIVSGIFFKMSNLTQQKKHQELNDLLIKYKDSIMATSPYLEYELKNQMAINAINLNNNALSD